VIDTGSDVVHDQETGNDLIDTGSDVVDDQETANDLIDTGSDVVHDQETANDHRVDGRAVHPTRSWRSHVHHDEPTKKKPGHGPG
jgi:hypothetical protein